MIVDKHKPSEKEEIKDDIQTSQDSASSEKEIYETNALCEVFNSVKNILGDLKENENDPNSPPLFKTIKLNNGQVSRLKHDKWNKEYALPLPAVFFHFIDVRYLVQQSRIGEGRAVMRIQYVLNRLNNSDAKYELEGYEIFQRINAAINSRKKEFPALLERFQLQYFDQPESFDDGVQPYWIDYEVWFSDYSGYRYKDYVDRYVVMPPFTNHSDQDPENNTEGHGDHSEPTIEDVARFVE